MTRKERAEIHRAMDLMWNQDDALGALEILKRLVGLDTSVEEALRTARSITVMDLAALPIREINLGPVIAVNNRGEPVPVENNQPFTEGCVSGCCWHNATKFHHHPYCRTYGTYTK